jgi:hypothetical protein
MPSNAVSHRSSHSGETIGQGRSLVGLVYRKLEPARLEHDGRDDDAVLVDVEREETTSRSGAPKRSQANRLSHA